MAAEVPPSALGARPSALTSGLPRAFILLPRPATPSLGGLRTPHLRRGSIAAALALLIPLASALPGVGPAFVPEVALGFGIQPLTPVPIATAIAFGPGGADGEDLYATTLLGTVIRIPLTWTPAGPIAGAPTTVVGGFSTPLGLVFDGDTLYVADSVGSSETTRTDGRVTKVVGTTKTVVVGGLPNGRHNTNNLRIGPDGMLYVANGNPNDDGVSGGDADVLPYSGAILRVDPDVVGASPAILRWRDASGNLIPPTQIASHPINADFASKVGVVGYGFRNVYDLAFGPGGAVYTATNGADATPSQDQFYRIDAPGSFHGFPFCLSVGTPGGTDITVVNSPRYPSHDCSGALPAQANLGWHVCATGMDVAPAGTFLDSAFVAECGPFFADVVLQSLADPAHATYNTGHKVARVVLDANGDAVAVRDFITGLHLPTDVLFGPDGAMYVADADAIYRVVELV